MRLLLSIARFALAVTVAVSGSGVAGAEIVRDHPDERLAAEVAEVVARINGGDRAETRDRLFTPDPERNSPSYGYGFMVRGVVPDREVGHGGSFPGVSARLSMFLDTGYTFLALCNGDGAQEASPRRLRSSSV